MSKRDVQFILVLIFAILSIVYRSTGDEYIRYAWIISGSMALGFAVATLLSIRSNGSKDF